MPIRHLFMAAALVVFFARCSCSPVTIAPPKVKEGGRAVSIAVTSNNVNRLVVATESGGLFRTFNGGKSWQHLNGLPNFATVDVAIAFSSAETIIATTRSRYHTVNDGGIWRSTDGGASWKQPVGSMQPPGPNCPSRPSAHGISHIPATRTFFVGTDCGVAVSNDNGATWSHFVLNPGATAPDSAPHRVRSLLVLNRSVGVAAADSGIFHLTPNGTWAASAIQVVNKGRVPVPHAFATPWFSGSPSIFFHASAQNQKIFVSTDTGATFLPITSPSVQNREAFVRIARPLSNEVDKFDVYIGDGFEFHRQTFKLGNNFKPSGNWTKLSIDHLDPSDVAFDLEFRKPILLATDGGVHVTTNSGSSWRLTGGGFDGFNALQINEVTGQAVTGSSPHLDLYYSTQDNYFRGSRTGGQTWDITTTPPGGEGRHLRTAPTSVDHKGTRVTGARNADTGDYRIFLTDPHFQSGRAWRSAPNGNDSTASDAPFELVEDVYLQPSFDKSVTPNAFDYYLTLSAGASWRKVFTLPLEPKGPPGFAGSLANPTVYQGVVAPGFVPNGTRFGLMRVKTLATTAAVSRADSLGMRAVGSLRTPVARYIVFGADPRNANHLIAPDILDKEMKFSVDAGTTWFPFPALTKAVTDSGRFIFTIGDASLASVVAWDPYNPCTVLVGTMQSGIAHSSDGGRSWKRIERSEVVTSISSFFFPPTGVIWISSSGRGLWTLDIDRKTGVDAARCPFPDAPPGGLPPDTVIVSDRVIFASRPFQGLQDTVVCPRCVVVLAKNGWLTDIQLRGDTVDGIAVSSGTVFQLDRTGKESPLSVPNVYRDGSGRFPERPYGRGLTANQLIRGLVLEGRRLRAVLSSREELPLAPARTSLVFVQPLVNTGEASTVRPGDNVRISGTGFVPAQPARILFDAEVVAPRVPVRADGSFSVDLRVQRPRGEVVVWVEQRDGQRLTRQRATIEVRGPE